MEFKKLEAKGLITINKHPEVPLFIANYTARVQYEQLWDEALLQCRGLIFDQHENIIARPFRKFFNLSEHQPNEIPKEPFEVFEKMDGSLGILYWIGDKPFIATRGSFTSEQAIEGTRILHKKYAGLFDKINREATYLFEIIYPNNRIVVDYGNQKDLILLAVIDNKTGKDLPLPDIGFRLVNRYFDINDVKELVALEVDNKEGFVVRFQSGFRVKVKFAEYIRLHKIVTQVSSKMVWEYLKEGKSMDALLEEIPDELYDWVKTTKGDLIRQFEEIAKKAEEALEDILADLPEGFSDKDFALKVVGHECTPLLFSLYKGKDISDRVWRMIKPEFEKPFSV
ncbi:MAG: 2'-5' RNA ligase [Bacteroidetes bacterium]|nr:MAG: 2'-5' RNA ligase [Bacteroidota bacterium]